MADETNKQKNISGAHSKPTKLRFHNCDFVSGWMSRDLTLPLPTGPQEQRKVGTITLLAWQLRQLKGLLSLKGSLWEAQSSVAPETEALPEERPEGKRDREAFPPPAAQRKPSMDVTEQVGCSLLASSFHSELRAAGFSSV